MYKIHRLISPLSHSMFPICCYSFPSPIPVSPWYSDPSFVVPAAGLLPFGSIFIEMYFIFTAFWSYKFYYVYGFMLLVYAILTLVTICTTIVAVYFILNAENFHWQWIAFNSAGSTAAYVFLYSVFYFFYKTQMSGLLQIAFYFGYMYATFVFTATIDCLNLVSFLIIVCVYLYQLYDM